jgi:hypothetical protein
MPTVQDIRDVSAASKPNITEYMNCGYINRALAASLREELGVTATVVIGGIWQTRGKREEHAYVTIPAGEVVDSSRDVIIDGSIRQFCEENIDDLWVVLGPKEALPDVAVLTGNEPNGWYDMFRPDRP